MSAKSWTTLRHPLQFEPQRRAQPEAGGNQKAIDLNQTSSVEVRRGCKRRARRGDLDGWRRSAVARGDGNARAVGLSSGYHNHQAEFKPVEGKRPIEVLAASTPKDFMMQFDVGTCVEVGDDPVAWINANPGRIKSLHLKDWGKPVADNKERGYRVLFGEGDAPWQKIFAAAESTGGAEYYLIEQEGSRYPSLETAERCLALYKKMRQASPVSCLSAGP
jgi:sugar phosphate isomerase/epimerase